MAKSRQRGNKSAGAIKINLAGVETSTTVAEGNYIVEVESIETKFSENSKSNYLSFTFVIQEGKFKGQKLFHNCSLQPQALFNLKGVLVALGFEIPDEEFELDTESLVGLQCGVEVSHEVYEGKKKARITDFINLDDEEIDSSDEDGEDEEDEDSDGEESDVDLESLDMDELKQLAKALGITAKAMKKAKTEEALIELIEEEDEDDIAEKFEELFGEEDSDDEEDEDEDEEENDYEEMSLKELKAEAKDRGLKVKKGMSKEDIIEMLEEDDEE